MLAASVLLGAVSAASAEEFIVSRALETSVLRKLPAGFVDSTHRRPAPCRSVDGPIQGPSSFPPAPPEVADLTSRRFAQQTPLAVDQLVAISLPRSSGASKRSSIITLCQTLTKSRTKRWWPSVAA